MRSLVCVLLVAGLGACLPDDVDLDHPILAGSAPGAGGSLGPGTTDNGGGNVPVDAAVSSDGGTVITDGGVFDAGPFLDAFDFPQDAPEPSNPTDQIP